MDAFDCNGLELNVGDKVRARCDLYGISGPAPEIEGGDLLEIDSISKNGWLGFKEIHDYLSFPSENFSRVSSDKSEKELLEENIAIERGKIEYMHNNIRSRIEIIEKMTAKIFEMDGAPVEFTVDGNGMVHRNDSDGKKNDVIGVVDDAFEKMGYIQTVGSWRDHVIGDDSDSVAYLDLKTDELVIVEYTRASDELKKKILDGIDEANSQFALTGF